MNIEEPPMRHYLRDICVLVVLAALVVIATLSRPRTTTRRVSPSIECSPALIEAGHPVKRSFEVRLHWLGRVIAKRDVHIVSRIAGRITAINVQEGAEVKDGQVLFTLGGEELRNTIETLRKQIEAKEKQIACANHIVQLRRQAVSQHVAKLEDAIVAQQTEADLNSSLSGMKGRLSTLERAALIRAPMNGIFVNRQVNKGQYVDRGSVLADIISKDLRIVAYAFATPGTRLLGKAAIVDLGNGKTVRGRVVKILPTVTAEGASVIWIESDEISKQLTPGQPACGWIEVGVGKPSLAIPADALVRDDKGRTFVIVKSRAGYRSKPVTIGVCQGGWCQILSGISTEDQIVTKGAYEVFYSSFAKTYKVPD